MPTAFSYVRFSSEKQRHGASFERQVEAATLYAHTHSLVLDTSTYRDLGVSAFRSKNVEGALGAFIEAVDAKRIAKGSYLLVESLDRLSRDTVDVALELFLGITRRGIVIVTLLDEKVYSQATIKQNWTDLIVAMAIMARANEESATKADRAHDAIKRRADRSELPTTRLPTWMRFSTDRKSAILIPDRAKIIKEVFDRSIAGAGARELCRDFNLRNVPVLFYAKEWRQASLSQLLKNPATYGEFKGEIRFPAVITKARFMKAQQVVRDRTLHKGGFSRFNPNNTFVGLARCGHCGRTMRYLPHQTGPSYIRCVGSVDHGMCNARLFHFGACEAALVVHLTLLETNFGLTRAIFTERHEQAEALEGEIAMVKTRQERLVRLAEVSGDVEALGAQLKKLQADVKALEAKRTAVGVVVPNEESVELFSAYSALVAGRDDGGQQIAANITELRKKLKMALVRVLKKIEFLNANEKKWKPTLRLTYVNDRVDSVDVTPFLPERTQVQIKHGIYAHPNRGKRRKKATTK